MPDPEAYGIESIPGGIAISLYVTPRASINKVVGAHDGAVKVALAAPPVEGAANKALVEFLARALDVPRSSVSLVSGHTSRRKVVRVLGIEAQEALRKLDLGD
jgi:uncharacterized protein